MCEAIDLTRRSFIATTAAAATVFSLPAHGQAQRFTGRQVVSHTFASTRDLFQARIGPWLKQTTGGELSLLPLLDAVAYARMQAELADPQIDIFVSISENEFDSKAKGTSQKITFLENAMKVPPARRDPDGFWIHWAAIGQGILYRTDKVTTPPTSYMDMFKPEYAKHVGFASIMNTYGLDFLVMMARIGGGGENNIEPGFAALKKLKDGGATILRGTPAEVQQQFAQNDMWLLPYDTGNAHLAQQAGLPIGFAVPKEGAPALFCSAFITRSSKNADMASVVIDRMLSPEIQSQIASTIGFAPINPEASLDGVKLVFPKPEQIVELDRLTMRANRPQWTERFQREISY